MMFTKMQQDIEFLLCGVVKKTGKRTIYSRILEFVSVEGNLTKEEC